MLRPYPAAPCTQKTPGNVGKAGIKLPEGVLQHHSHSRMHVTWRDACPSTQRQAPGELIPRSSAALQWAAFSLGLLIVLSALIFRFWCAAFGQESVVHTEGRQSIGRALASAAAALA